MITINMEVETTTQVSEASTEECLYVIESFELTDEMLELYEFSLTPDFEEILDLSHTVDWQE